MEERERRGTQILNFTACAALTKNGGARGQERDSSREGEQGRGEEGREGEWIHAYLPFYRVDLKE